MIKSNQVPEVLLVAQMLDVQVGVGHRLSLFFLPYGWGDAGASTG